ncbi:hypothetical protein GGX14DRAFT_479695, partial [Mycena pura]
RIAVTVGPIVALVSVGALVAGFIVHYRRRRARRVRAPFAEFQDSEGAGAPASGLPSRVVSAGTEPDALSNYTFPVLFLGPDSPEPEDLDAEKAHLDAEKTSVQDDSDSEPPASDPHPRALPSPSYIDSASSPTTVSDEKRQPWPWVRAWPGADADADSKSVEVPATPKTAGRHGAGARTRNSSTSRAPTFVTIDPHGTDAEPPVPPTPPPHYVSGRGRPGSRPLPRIPVATAC